MRMEEEYATDSPTNSEDSTSSTFSPFSASGANAKAHKPASFSMPSFKLPKLRLKPVAAAVPAPAAVSAAPGRPPLAASGGFCGSGSLRRGGSSLQHGGGSLKSAHAGSQELVVAWGKIRGQDSTDFARMLQLIDDKDFDAAQAAYEATQRRSAAVC